MADTVRFGIDLGTTNSAIARMTAKGAEIIPIRQANYIPSAVDVDRRGELKVGAEAVRLGNVAARWFKRLMGTRNTLSLSDGSTWSPERLSAEVLKALAAAAKLKTNEDVREAVITVPAMFTQPQCAATNEAAQLAGIHAVALLQEPIAAATAYLSDDPVDGHYLVYDLGGGTFDVSIIRLLGGEMNVVQHGGDNYLGGSDFDRAVFDWVVEKVGGAQVFEAPAARRQLLSICEEARVALSDQETATLYLDEFNLSTNKLELERTRLEDLLEGLVTRTVNIAKDQIRAALLNESNLCSILLVGGPTQMPYIRRRLAEELQTSINLDQDPMTVVAKGAAIHASSIISRLGSTTQSSGDLSASLSLHFEPVSNEQTEPIAAKVTTPQGFAGEVRLRSRQGDWETGWIALRNSAFATEVKLSRGPISEFEIELRDAGGRPVSCSPSSFSIRTGVRSAQAIAPYNYGVILEGGGTGRLISAGDPLPLTQTYDYRLARRIVAGSTDQATIYFFEGGSDLADENVKVGSLVLKGSEIRRTLNENERVEVRMKMDESRRLSARVYIPLLDEDFEVRLASFTEAPDCEELKTALEATKEAVHDLGFHIEEQEETIVLQTSRQLEHLEAVLERVEKGETGEAERLYKQLSDVKASIRPLVAKHGLTSTHSEILERADQAEELCQLFDDRMGIARLGDLRGDADRALRLEQAKALDNILESVNSIFWEHYVKTRECWEFQIAVLTREAHLASDPLAFHELLRKAQDAMMREDFEGVLVYVGRAWDLLPDARSHRGRFYDAALRR